MMSEWNRSMTSPKYVNNMGVLHFVEFKLLMRAGETRHSLNACLRFSGSVTIYNWHSAFTS